MSITQSASFKQGLGSHEVKVMASAKQNVQLKSLLPFFDHTGEKKLANLNVFTRNLLRLEKDVEISVENSVERI